MGCFSWICPVCKKAILSSSFDGQECILFLLHRGKVVEKMQGRYDSYGTVFPDGSHELLEPAIEPISELDLAKEKEDKIIWEYAQWNTIAIWLASTASGTGIAAFHKECYNGTVPMTVSVDDPNQGEGFNTKEENNERPS